MFDSSTIAAISTPQGTGGIGIIRLSGKSAFHITEKIFKGRKPFKEIKSHTINYGRIIEPVTGEVIDEVLVSKMNAPNTFTREDVVEINCHGGVVILRRILEMVLKEGAAVAEPGEFTKRAFLNGRIDLSQAEAVIDVINSKTKESSRAAVEQLEGRLSKKLKEIREKLIKLIAHIEVTVDYPEHDIEEITGQQAYDDIVLISRKLKDVLINFEKGRIIREGISAVIVGRPNVGKSSLMNHLSGKSRAIVTDIPGTTRDIIEEYVNISGVPVKLMDTAGIRETEDVVERIGVERANTAIDSADLIIMMIDALEGLSDEDLNIYGKIHESKKLIILINKIDTVDQAKIDAIRSSFPKENVILISLKEDIGLDLIEKEFSRLFLSGEMQIDSDVLVTNIRHKNLIEKATGCIDEAAKAYECGMPIDCMTIDIRNAAEYLAQITGESVSEDVMHEIFSRFCVGK